MVSKPQEAAFVAFKEIKANLLKDIKNNTASPFFQIFVGGYWDVSIENINERIGSIGSFIKEHGLEKRLFTDMVKEVYDLLMNRKEYKMAAVLAKKYGF